MISAPKGMVAVVIGRNEGSRLDASIRSIEAAGLPVVYADSGSVDGSVTFVRERGIPVVELDPSLPFSAGRGRNEGLAEALRHWPDTSYVLFLDGDCILDPGFPSAAVATFDNDPRCAIVTGHLAERFPERSIYNRLCQIEWRSAAGEITNMNSLGGIMAARVSAFTKVGRFRLKAIAGEEPDLGARLAMAGYKIIKIDAPMATHDADMVKFGQWWKRAVRGGHALAYRYSQHGRTHLRDGQRELLSDLFWGLALPLASLALLWPTRGLSLLLFGGYALLGARIYGRYHASGLSSSDSLLVSRFILYSKFAHVLGIFIFCRNWLRGEFRIIEYK
jgi:GT2 family glycosyltransferase